MDGNKPPAMEMMDVVKRMIADHDYLGARSKLLEIQCQFPTLHNVSQMIAACDILCAAELTLPDVETDWYWILQVGPAASLSQITSQHRKLTALLDGIKDNFPCVVAALELVENAFSVLSNLSKRLFFDSKRMTNWDVSEILVSPTSFGEKERDSSPICESSISKSTAQQKSSGYLEEKGAEPVEPDETMMQGDEVHDSGNNENEKFDIVKLNKEVHSSSGKSIPSSSKYGLKKEIQIKNPDDVVICKVDDDLEKLNSVAAPRGIPRQRINGKFYDFDSTRKPDVFAIGQIWAAYDDENFPRRYAQINNISRSPFKLAVSWLQPVPRNSDERKWCEAGLPVVCGTFNLDVAKDSLIEHTSLSHLVSYTASPMYDQFEIYPKENEIWAIYKDWNPFEWCEKPESRKACFLQIVQVSHITEGCQEQEDMIVVNLVKVDGFQNIYKIDTNEGKEGSFLIPSRCIYWFSHRLPAYAFKGGEMAGVSCGMFELDSSPINASYSIKSSNPSFQSSPSSSAPKANSLKLEWSSEDFSPGQVWAIYDGPDQMPRRYVVVKNMLSRIEVNVAFLEPHPIHDEEISWLEENLPPGCGTFRHSSTIATLQISKFSHLVHCEQSSKKSFYRIYPRKGEFWAVYTNWSSKWKQQNFEHYHCRIVEIMSDFSEQTGLVTAVLEEVPGYKTFFQRRLSNGFILNRVVPRVHMLSFSHRVEAFVVPGIEKYGIPSFSWHLEPDALPPLLAN